jgi:peptidoglycan hydrolase CwlO-like protein
VSRYNEQIEKLKREKLLLEEEKNITNSQEKLDFLDGEIYELEDSIEKLKGYV